MRPRGTSGTSALDAVPAPILYLDENGRIVGCNAAAEAAFGCQMRNLRGKQEQSILASGRCPPLDPAAGPVLASYRLPDGTVLRAEARCAPVTPEDGVGLSPSYLRFLRDVGREVQVRQELEQTRRRFQLFLEHSPAAIAMLDRDMRYIATSRRFIEDYGLAEESVVGMSHYDVFPETPKRWRRIHQRCLDGAEESRGEETFERKDGRVDWIRWEVRPWQDDQGEIGGLMIYTEFITDQKLNEEAIRHAQKMESLGVMAGGAAHDFNNLLVAMMGQMSLARSKLPPGSPAVDHLRKAENAAARAADLTRQMLAYSGRGTSRVQALDLDGMIRDNLHLFEAALQKNVLLRADLADGLPMVVGDVAQLQQVIMNLILNAADSIADEPGRVTVSTLVRHIDGQDTRLWMQTGRALEPGEYVVLEVSDTGAGMNRATMARIFDPFFTTKPAGRGLGLAAVLGIVRAHGGGLAVRSEKSQGSTFTVLLPAASDDAVRPEQEPDNLSLSEGIVLVIDDEAPVREAVTEMLEEEGYGVAAAATAREALELFGTWQHAIGLVLLDFSLPGKTGKAIYRELAEIEPSVKVLLSSGYSESEVTKDFPEGALWGFIQKPYQPAALLREVRKAFREQG